MKLTDFFVLQDPRTREYVAFDGNSREKLASGAERPLQLGVFKTHDDAWSHINKLQDLRKGTN